MEKTTRIRRKEAVTMSEAISQYIKEMKLSVGLNTQRIFAAWDAVSGAARFTIGKYYKDGVLYCTISSSVMRNQLYFQLATVLEMLNETLKRDNLYDGDKGYVKSIVLR